MHRCWLVAFALSLLSPLSRAAPIRVDINPDNDRRDVLTKGWTDWRVGEADAADAALELNKVKVSFRGKVGASMWKGGFDTGATMTSDGIVARGAVEMVISGLPPGRTSIATYHNAFGLEQSGPFSVAVNGEVKLRGVKPTYRVANDYDAASAFVEID